MTTCRSFKQIAAADSGAGQRQPIYCLHCVEEGMQYSSTKRFGCRNWSDLSINKWTSNFVSSTFSYAVLVIYNIVRNGTS